MLFMKNKLYIMNNNRKMKECVHNEVIDYEKNDTIAIIIAILSLILPYVLVFIAIIYSVIYLLIILY